jgi:hypothetical protein
MKNITIGSTLPHNLVRSAVAYFIETDASFTFRVVDHVRRGELGLIGSRARIFPFWAIFWYVCSCYIPWGKQRIRIDLLSFLKDRPFSVWG